MTFARMGKLQGRGLVANSRVDWPQTNCAETKQLRKNHAMALAPPLFNLFALPTKSICAAREMEPARRIGVPVTQIVTARAPSFVALITVIGLRASTAARKNAKGMGVALQRVLARQVRVPAKMERHA